MKKYVTATKIAEHGCVGKVRHPNRKIAKEVLAIMKEKAIEADKKRLQIYPCGDHFHVGRIGKVRD